MTYEEILVQCHYLYDRSTLCTAHTRWHNMKWEISKDVFEVLREEHCMATDISCGLIVSLLGYPVNVLWNETEYIKLFIEVE